MSFSNNVNSSVGGMSAQTGDVDDKACKKLDQASWQVTVLFCFCCDASMITLDNDGAYSSIFSSSVVYSCTEIPEVEVANFFKTLLADFSLINTRS